MNRCDVSDLSPLRLIFNPSELLADDFANGEADAFSAVGFPNSGRGDASCAAPFGASSELPYVEGFSSMLARGVDLPWDGINGFRAGSCSRTMLVPAVKTKGRDDFCFVPNRERGSGKPVSVGGVLRGERDGVVSLAH